MKYSLKNLFKHLLTGIKIFAAGILLPVLYFNIRIIVGALRATPLRWVLYGFIVLTGLVEAVWGLRQLYGFEMSQHNLFKMTGFFFNPGPYAGYLAVVFPHCKKLPTSAIGLATQPYPGKRGAAIHLRGTTAGMVVMSLIINFSLLLATN